MSSPADVLAPSAAWSAHDRWLRRRLLDRLAGLRGRITLRAAEGEGVSGTPEPGAEAPPPDAPRPRKPSPEPRSPEDSAE